MFFFPSTVFAMILLDSAVFDAIPSHCCMEPGGGALSLAPAAACFAGSLDRASSSTLASDRSCLGGSSKRDRPSKEVAIVTVSLARVNAGRLPAAFPSAGEDEGAMEALASVLVGFSRASIGSFGSLVGSFVPALDGLVDCSADTSFVSWGLLSFSAETFAGVVVGLSGTSLGPAFVVALLRDPLADALEGLCSGTSLGARGARFRPSLDDAGCCCPTASVAESCLGRLFGSLPAPPLGRFSARFLSFALPPVKLLL
mmetsp:Transcript_36115/g.76048  ORF Transcript_36115/g.76048 Transcript_36115/m.76048 type:complete len:257 (-) Transcript_36115:1102-1872(-)